MAWTLAGNVIPKPQEIQFTPDTQEVVRRTLSGTYVKRYVGANKRVLQATYSPISATDWAVIYGHWNDQRLNGTSKTLVVDELAFSASVHISMQPATYNIKNNYEYFDFSVVFIER